MNALSHHAVPASRLSRAVLIPAGIVVALAMATAPAQTVPTSGLIAHFSAEGNVNDSSSFANNGSFSGSYGSGLVGQAFQVNGTNYVSVPDAAQYAVSDFSVAFWFKGTASGVFIGQDEGSGTAPKWFVDYGYINAGVFNLHLNGNPSLTVLSSNSVSPSSSDWHNFALVKDGNLFSFFLDGAAIGTQTNTYSIPNPAAPLTIGFAESTVPSFNGLLDEIVFYNRALTLAEVQQLAAIPEPAALPVLAGAIALGFCICRRWCAAGCQLP